VPNHPEPPGEICCWPRCAILATHKIGEEAPVHFHNMTAYLCCTHMQMLGMDCDDYPYAEALTDPSEAIRRAYDDFRRARGVIMGTLPAEEAIRRARGGERDDMIQPPPEPRRLTPVKNLPDDT
jgi:hypothetical protein